jgi:hypothetical protein
MMESNKWKYKENVIADGLRFSRNLVEIRFGKSELKKKYKKPSLWDLHFLSRRRVMGLWNLTKITFFYYIVGFHILPPVNLSYLPGKYEEKTSIILKYRFWTRVRDEPACMHVESSRMRVKSTRSMVRLQCRAVCWFNTHAGDSFSNGRRHLPVA